MESGDEQINRAWSFSALHLMGKSVQVSFRLALEFNAKWFLKLLVHLLGHQQWFSFPVLSSDPFHPCWGALKCGIAVRAVRSPDASGCFSGLTVSECFRTAFCSWTSRVFEAAVLVHSRSAWSLPNSEVQICQSCSQLRGMCRKPFLWGDAGLLWRQTLTYWH